MYYYLIRVFLLKKHKKQIHNVSTEQGHPDGLDIEGQLHNIPNPVL